MRVQDQFRRTGTRPVIAALCGLMMATASPAATVGSPIILRNVTIVDTLTGGLSFGQSVVVRNGMIEMVAPTEDDVADPSATIIEAEGKFLVPGYNDMHTHMLSYGDTARNQQLMLANGITGFNVPGGDPALIAAINAGEDVTPGDGPDALGFTPEGHIAHALPLRQVVEGRARLFDHLGAGETILVGASTEEDALRAAIAADPQRPPGPGAELLNFLSNPLAHSTEGFFERVATIIATFDEDKAREMAEYLVANDVWQIPTLIRLRTMIFGDASEYTGDPNLAYVTEMERARWLAISEKFTDNAPEDRAALTEFFTLQMRMVGLLNQAGAPILSGSDYGGGLVVPGFSLHQEFALLQQSGLTLLEVLQSTTLNPAKYLGREDQMGSIASGMRGDLVLLNSNPLDDVGNLADIFGVMQGGTYYDRADLEGFLGIAQPSPVPVPGAILLMLSAMGLGSLTRLSRRSRWRKMSHGEGRVAFPLMGATYLCARNRGPMLGHQSRSGG